MTATTSPHSLSADPAYDKELRAELIAYDRYQAAVMTALITRSQSELSDADIRRLAEKAHDIAKEMMVGRSCYSEELSLRAMPRDDEAAS